MNRPRSREERARKIERLWNANVPVDEIARAVGCSLGTVSHWRVKLGLAPRPVSRRMKLVVMGLQEMYPPELVRRWLANKEAR